MNQHGQIAYLVAEQLEDLFALGVMLKFGDRLALEYLTVEIAAQHENAIVLDFVPIKAEEGMFRLEVPDLQKAVNLGRLGRPPAKASSVSDNDRNSSR